MLMSAGNMRVDEVNIDVALVRRLLAAQFPQWADLPITPVPSAGTDNALYRLDQDMAVRLPRVDWAIEQVAKEQRWLPRLAPHLPLAIPVPLALRPERDHRSHRRSNPGGERAGSLYRRPAADRSGGRATPWTAQLF